MKYESTSENHTIEEGHTHFPRLASPRTQRFSRAFAYFVRSTIPMEKTIFFKKIYLFIHISTWKQILNIICSQVAELIEPVKVHIHKKEKK